MPPVRLQKLLSAAGIASRRAAEALIAEGRVSVNGQTVTELGSKADPDTDDVRVDGRRIKVPTRRLYLLLNKPRGYISSRVDPQHRPTVIDLLAKKGIREYVYPVGRLDYDSEGLLILTSDGELAARLTHPRHGIEREYEVRVRGAPDRHALQRLARGVIIEGRRTLPADVRLSRTIESAGGPQSLLSLVVREGRNRQVRKMCDEIGHPVVRLRRVRIGPIVDERLRPGEVRDLTPKEIAALREGGHSRPDPEVRPTERARLPRSSPGSRSRRRQRSGRLRRG